MSSNPHSSAPSPRASHSSILRSRRNRTVLGGAVLMVALPVLAACSAGTNPQAYQVKPDSGMATAGFMWISNVWVVADSNTGNAEVIGQLANTNPDQGSSLQLTSVTVNGNPMNVQAAAASNVAPGVQVAGDDVTIPGLRSVQFGQKGQPMLLATSPGVIVGQTAQVVYTFSDGSKATVTAQVQPNAGLWAAYNPNGPATATALPTIEPGSASPLLSPGTASPSTTLSPTSSASANVTVSGTPNPSSSL